MDLLLLFLIIVIGIIQLNIFFKNLKKIKTFKSIFDYNDLRVVEYSEYSSIYSTTKNDIFKTIANSINSYLQNNGKRSSDYQLMQDIVERNCDNADEEINAQIPTTLYLGLVGTMLGIIIGIFQLFHGESGGLDELLNGTNSTNTEGISNLLSGVAMAMVASMLGIILTTISTFIFKNAKAKCGSGKNLFLSWIQANLLPKMSSDIHVALDKMAATLSEFNSQFTENTQRLNETLELVNDTSDGQAEMLQTLKDLDVAQMAKANVKVYKSLIDCSSEIGNLAAMLSCSTTYLTEVRNLNESLDKSEQRTKYYEEMGNYFKNEIESFDARRLYFEEKVEEIEKSNESKINHFSGAMESKTENVMTEIQEKLESNLNEFHKFAGIQEDAIKENMTSLTSLPKDIKALDSRIASIEKTVDLNNSDLSTQLSQFEDNMNAKIASVLTANTENNPKVSPYRSSIIWGAILLVCILSSFITYFTGSYELNHIFWFGVVVCLVGLIVDNVLKAVKNGKEKK